MRFFTLACGTLLILSCPDGVLAQPCKPVAPARLEALLPMLNTFTREAPTSETDTDPPIARTTVRYEEAGGAANIGIEIMDSCRNSDILSQLRELLKTGPPQTPGTVFRSVPVGGFPAYEEWTAESKHTEIHILVADRFAVKVRGSLVDVAVVRSAANKIDLKTLAGLK